MRTLTAFLTLILTASTALSDLSRRDIQGLIEEYHQADEVRRTEIVQMLSDADARMTSSLLHRGVRDEETVGSLLELALALRVPGLWRGASRHLDGDHDANILRYGLIMEERGAADAAWRRWLEVEHLGPAWQTVNSVLSSVPLTADTITTIKAWVDRNANDERHGHALHLLRIHLHVPQDVSDREMLLRWEALFSAHVRDSRIFELTGADLLEGVSGPRVYRNLRLENGSVRLTADKTWQGNCVLVLHIRTPREGRVTVTLSGGQGVWESAYNGGEWEVETAQSDRYTLASAPGTWAELRFVLTTEAADSRLCRIMVDGRDLLSAGRLNGDVSALKVQMVGVGVLGGVELIQNAR